MAGHHLVNYSLFSQGRHKNIFTSQKWKPYITVWEPDTVGGWNQSERQRRQAGSALLVHLSRPSWSHPSAGPLASCSRYSCNGSDLLRVASEPLRHTRAGAPRQDAHSHPCPGASLPTPRYSTHRPTPCPTGPTAEFAEQNENVKSLVQKAGKKLFSSFQSLSLDLSQYIWPAISCGTPSSRQMLTRWMWTLPSVQGTTQDQAAQSRGLRTHLGEAGKRRARCEQRPQAPQRRLCRPSNFLIKHKFRNKISKTFQAVPTEY